MARMKLPLSQECEKKGYSTSAPSHLQLPAAGIVPEAEAAMHYAGQATLSDQDCWLL